MSKMRYRQVHLDFHTTEKITPIAGSFAKKQFQTALKAGHVNSITLCSKCHHGWSYHPTQINEMHPGLKFDLLKAQMEACEEIDVKTPVYISAGYDEKYAVKNPHHLVKSEVDKGADFLNKAEYHRLCFCTPYLDFLIAQIEEVMQMYNPEGIFLDISTPQICYCQHCLSSMRAKGMDPHDPEQVRRHGVLVYEEYCRRCEEAIHKYNKETTIFHNAGNITRGLRHHAYFNTHMEIESLPTSEWGYDYFPMSAAYCRTLDREFLGMTGKFHSNWGEFGGFKHPNALRYETALSLALGAKCSIGDQLHPDCKMNMSTYELIGKAYREVELKEPYVRDAHHLTDVAVLSAEAFTGKPDRACPYDVGASRILLEGKYLFNMVDQFEDLTKYKLLVLPDKIRINEELRNKLEYYLKNGGKILCSGESGLSASASEFAFDMGVEYEGVHTFCPNYMIPEYEAINGKTAYICYTEAQRVKVCKGRTIALFEESYFNRTPEHFCSHMHTPNHPHADYVGAVIGKNTGYIAWNIFEDYAKTGSYHLKELVLYMMDSLIGEERSIKTKLPDRGIATLTCQKQWNRYIVHLLFAHTTKRGVDTEIIEDIIPLYNVELEVKLFEKPKRVYQVAIEKGSLKEEEISFTYAEHKVYMTLNKIDLHAMVVLEY